MKYLRALLALLLTGAALALAAPAQATPTFTAAWLLPEQFTVAAYPNAAALEAVVGTDHASMFPQARLVKVANVPCGRIAQVDVYSASPASLGDTLDWVDGHAEDSAIYLSHTWAFGAPCVTTVEVPALTVTPPTCDEDGTLPFLSNPPAQNANGYEFPGQGFRVYLSPAFAGPGVYTATIQKVGPGFDPAFPGGTKVTGATSQTLTVEGRLATQSEDSEAPCYVEPEPEPTQEPTPTETPSATPEPTATETPAPVVAQVGTPAAPTAQRTTLASTGPSDPLAWITAAALVATGAGATIWARRRRLA